VSAPTVAGNAIITGSGGIRIGVRMVAGRIGTSSPAAADEVRIGRIGRTLDTISPRAPSELAGSDESQHDDGQRGPRREYISRRRQLHSAGHHEDEPPRRQERLQGPQRGAELWTCTFGGGDNASQ
jgi:hypothetical protein